MTRVVDSGVLAALLLGMAAFAVYLPSLLSDFVYDARKEMLEEGFVTSLANLPAVLSLKVLNMDLMLASRPGEMVYLMGNAAVWGKDPFGYHLSSNLLHAANVALLFGLVLRLVRSEVGELAGGVKAQVVAAVATLIFALHPMAVESVAEVSYSSSLLVTLFALGALWAATFFRAEDFRVVLLAGGVGVFCALAATTCKESGLAVAPVLLVYWLLFRRGEAMGPWVSFLGAALGVSVAFLTLRFLYPPPGLDHLDYLGGSLPGVFREQPRLWVFMMGKLVWPVGLSADYTMADVVGLSSGMALTVLAGVVALQGWLAARSRLGALGVAVYWLGLATVSNFVPLLHVTADRYYYLPLVGVAMQVAAVLLMTIRRGGVVWIGVLTVLVALGPLTWLTLERESVFASNLALWSDTVAASPQSETAHYGVGRALLEKGRTEEAIGELRKAIKLKPDDYEARNNLGVALVGKGETEAGIAEFEKTLALNPGSAQAHYNLGVTYFQEGAMEKARGEFEATLRLKPDDGDARGYLEKMRAVGK